MTTRDELLQILLAAKEQVPVALEAARSLRNLLPDAGFTAAQTATSNLLRIQSRRLKLEPVDVQGLESLVRALRQTRAENVDMYVWAQGATMRSVVVGPELQLIACVIGPNRRE